MQDAFGFIGGARGVEDEERIFGIHDFRLTLRALSLRSIVIPNIAAALHSHFAAGVLDHQNLFYLRALREGLVDVLLELDVFSSAHAFVSRDDELAIAIGNAI